MLRYWHAVRYQPGRQVVGRLRHAASMAVCRFASAAGWSAAIGRVCDLRAGGFQVNEDFRYPGDGPYPHGGNLGANRFRFLEEAVDFESSIDWDAADKSLLWRFHLNYFDWLPRLAREQPELGFEQIHSWIDSNPAGRQPAWHPYPTSLRVANWVRALAPFDAPLRSNRIPRSLSRQTAFLEANLEYHLGGNHLIENAHALLVAGLFFRCGAAPRWEARGLDLLISELQTQVLPDGGHFERSLSYHFRVNLVCREAMQLLQANGREVPAELIVIDNRMSRFTAQLLHDDGNIPLFHDSQLIEEEAWTRFHSLQPA
jgi:uncharacterized heparinase superfamily protein